MNLLYIAKSKIHGSGLFTSVDIQKDSCICLIADFSKYINSMSEWITNFGKRVNHLKSGNTELRKDDCNKYYLYSNRNISAGEELTSDYMVLPACFDRDIKGYNEG